MCGRILYIFNTVATKNERPVGFRIGVVFSQNLFVDAHSLIIFIVATKMISAIIEISASIIVKLRQSLFSATAIAHSYGVTGGKFQRSAAHFAFEDCHRLLSFFYSFIQIVGNNLCKSSPNRDALSNEVNN